MKKEERLVDITQPIKRPSSFDELLALATWYDEMETIIDSLNKPNSCLIVDEDPDNQDAPNYTLDSEYSTLLIRTLELKMKEIRNVLNFN